jgi:hypothetical protein
VKTYYRRRGKLKEALDILEILKKIRRVRQEKAGG